MINKEISDRDKCRFTADADLVRSDRGATKIIKSDIMADYVQVIYEVVPLVLFDNNGAPLLRLIDQPDFRQLADHVIRSELASNNQGIRMGGDMNTHLWCWMGAGTVFVIRVGIVA